MPLLRRIELYLVRADIRPSVFGRLATGDPGFVAALRRGRSPRPPTEAKVRAFLDHAEKTLGGKRCRRR
jgi:hypothetical protein